MAATRPRPRPDVIGCKANLGNSLFPASFDHDNGSSKIIAAYFCSVLLLVSSERCVRNFVGKDTLVVVTATVDGHKGDGMVVNLYIRDAGDVFTSHADAAFDVCFENVPSGSQRLNSPTRHIELDIDIGADAKDWSAIQATEKLKPVEAELRRIEEITSELVTEMEYLRAREQKLRDTNESTNNRVKWFGIATTWLLIGLWLGRS
ncbi:endoplasmic reticulum vesicle protein 25, partial [Fusarium flagelliforme]|uniref:endoplasmic reticulum vesicle protein 25 n=1 Tax=Fusarium flagelliforme TaxID=2675880 RepID=UPI001E8DF377